MEIPYQIPPAFQALYNEGKVKISGATLRWVQDNKVAAHMVPVSKSASEKMAQTLGNLPGGIATLTPALQVINLGVNVVGFAYMAVKMESISRQIAALDISMKAVARDVQTVRQINETAMTAALLAGIEDAERGERFGDRAMLHVARRELNRGFLHHLSMIPAMIHDGNAAEQLPAVEAHVQRAVLLATAIARCDWLAEGPTEASNWLRQADKRLRSVLNELRDTYLKNYDFIEHLAKDEGPVKAFFDRSRSLLGVLESHAAQINHAAILKLPAPSDWDKYLLEQAKKSDVLFISSIPMSEEQD